MKRNSKDNTHVFDRFEYHLEDVNCCDCLHNKACDKESCRYEEIRKEAVKNARIERPKNWFTSRYCESN